MKPTNQPTNQTNKQTNKEEIALLRKMEKRIFWNRYLTLR